MTGWWALLLAVGLIVANGWFVAAEFALVSLGRPSAEGPGPAGDRWDRLVGEELSDVFVALSSAQFGITSTSVLLGFVTERAVGDTLIRPVLDRLGLPEETGLVLSVALAFLFAASAQLVVGELLPKHLAIARPRATARVVVPLTRAFRLLLGPVIAALGRAAEAVAVHLLRVEVTAGPVTGHSLDEFARMIQASGQEGSLSSEQATLLRRAVALGDRRVEEVMVPRPDIVWLPMTATLSELRAEARRTGYSRFPVHGQHEDEVLGSVHIKDLLRIPSRRYGSTLVTELATPLLVVPESARLRRLLAELRRQHRTAALVVDEHGGTVGIVTLEDVLEELVGEIEDEFDEQGLTLLRVGRSRSVVDARLRVDHAAELFGEALPEGAYETLAGFVLDQLGHVPVVGEVLQHGRLELRITALEGTRITELEVRELDGDGGRG